jgi:hypothetical protein
MPQSSAPHSSGPHSSMNEPTEPPLAPPVDTVWASSSERQTPSSFPSIPGPPPPFLPPPPGPLPPQQAFPGPTNPDPATYATPAPDPSPGTDLSIPQEGVTRGLTAAAIGAVLVIVAWLLVGWWALLLALAAGAWATTVAITGDWVPDRDNIFLGVVAIGRLGSPRPASTTARATPVTALAIALLPLGGWLLAAAGTFLHHSSTGDVCKAYYAFEKHQSDTADSLSFDDSTWFDLLGKLGKTAEDYGGRGTEGDMIRSAGKSARTVAEGHGSGMFVTASVLEAEAAISPIMSLCSSEGD